MDIAPDALEDALVNCIDCNEGDLSEATNLELESASDSQPVENGDAKTEVVCSTKEQEKESEHNIEDEKKDEAARNESALPDEDNTEEKTCGDGITY